MGVTLHLLVATACVASLASEVLGGCTSASWGVSGDSSFQFDNVTVDLSGKDVVYVDVPTQSISGCQVVGMEAKFCDADHLGFTDNYTVVVQLDVKKPENKGVLSSTVHCVPLVAPTTKSPA